MKRGLIFIFALILLSSFASASVIINEIMPDPDDSCGDCTEWIELYADEETQSVFILDTNGSNQQLRVNLTILDYLIFTKNKTKFLELWNNGQINETKVIEFKNMKLNDHGDSVYLYQVADNGTVFLIDNFTYPSTGKNETWIRCGEDWIKSKTPTPGMPNNCLQNESESTKNLVLEIPTEIECNKNFSIVLKAYNFSFGLYDVKVDILNENEQRIGKVWNGTKWLSTNSYVKSALDVNNTTASTTLIFKIENYSGDAILRPRLRKTGEKNYEDFDEIYVEVLCENNTKANTEALTQNSKIKIINFPERARFGSTLRIEVEVYRGDTKKYALYAYVQDKNEKKVSEQITVHIDKKFSKFEDKLEIKLKCLNESGTYEIVVEGLGKKEKEEIYLEPCYNVEKEIKNENEKNFASESNLVSERSISSKELITHAMIQDKGSKVGKILPYALASLCLLFAIYLVIRKMK